MLHGTQLEYLYDIIDNVGYSCLKFFRCHFDLTQKEETQFWVSRRGNKVFKPLRFVPVSRVHHSFKYLSDRGFSEAQMRKALPILFYPSSIIEQNLNEMREDPAFQDDLESEHALNLCLYFIEKEFDYTSDGLWIDGKREFSQALLKAMEDEIGYEPNRSPDNRVSSATSSSSSSRVWQNNQSCHFNGGGGGLSALSHRQARNFSTASASSAAAKHFMLQNPFTWLRVHFDFQRIKAEWDASLDKDSFIEASKQVRETF